MLLCLDELKLQVVQTPSFLRSRSGITTAMSARRRLCRVSLSFLGGGASALQTDSD